MKPEELLRSVAGVLNAQECRDLSDAEIVRCLSDCVSGHILIPFAHALRDYGILTVNAGAVVIDESKV